MTYVETTPRVRAVLPPIKRERIRAEAARLGVIAVHLFGSDDGTFLAVLNGQLPEDERRGRAATPAEAFARALATWRAGW